MEQLVLIKLKPKAPFHLGERGVGIEETSEIVHSDTLFGALCWCWTLLTGKEPTDFLQPFLDGKPPFVLSSAFPFWQEILFVPQPPVPLPVKGDEQFKRDVQKVSFLSLRALEQMSQRDLDQHELTLLARTRLLALRDEADQLDDADKDPWTVMQVPRVTLDRSTSASEIFHAGRLVFAKDSGLYLLVRVVEPGAVVTLEALFRLMGDEGLGGERSCGYGFFESQFAEITLNLPETSTKLLLSLYNPKDALELEQFDLARSAYQLMRRRSWVFSARAKNLQTRAVNFFAEGSILQARQPERPGVHGRLVEVVRAGEGIPHSVYRNGLGFFISWQEKGPR